MNNIIDDDQSNDTNDEGLSFDIDELSTIGAHRRAVSSFDEKLLVWIQEVGREILQRADEAILDTYLESAKTRVEIEDDHDAQTVLVAVESVDHWIEVDPRDGEVVTVDDEEVEYKIYLSASELSTEPWELAQALVEKIEAWNEDEDE